jgi:release factor glutamine methyltransferase
LITGVTETLEAIVAEAAAVLARAGRVEPRRRARQLVAASLDLPPAKLLMHSEQTLGPGEAARVRRLIERVARGEPFSRVIGRREFWSLDFALSAETLDPRPDSETVVEAVLARVSDCAAGLRVLDLGTGTGCLLLALLSELPAAFGIGIDVCERAVATAWQNAQTLGLARRACFFVGDWGSAVGGQFDVVVANPPYIPTATLPNLPAEVREYDPWRALDGGEDGLASYHRIADQLPALLAPRGLFVGEVGAGQAAAAAALLRAGGLALDTFECDFAGIERCVVARQIKEGVSETAAAGQKNLGMCRRPV